jgi:hypothetical protein
LDPCAFADRGNMLLQKHQDQQSFERQKLAKNRRKFLSHPEKIFGDYDEWNGSEEDQAAALEKHTSIG